MPVTAIRRITLTDAGVQIAAGSAVGAVAVSPDGTRVIFESNAPDVVGGGVDTNAAFDLFMLTLATNALERVSLEGFGELSGESNNAYFLDNNRIVFATNANTALEANGAYDIYVRDLTTGALTLVSSDSLGVSSAGGDSNLNNGRRAGAGNLVVFDSAATNLVGGDTNGQTDVFVKNIVSGAISRVSVGPGAVEGDSFSNGSTISADGTRVLFVSGATNLVAGDTNGQMDLFMVTLATGAVTRVSTTSAGAQANGNTDYGVFSPDGTKIAFSSTASNLVAGDSNGQPDIFVKTLATGAVERVSVTAAGGQVTDGFTAFPAWSPDGARVAFRTYSQLLPADTNAAGDIYVKTLATGQLEFVSTTPAGVIGNADSTAPIFAPNGTDIFFATSATNLFPGDTNGVGDTYSVTVNFPLPPAVGGGGSGPEPTPPAPPPSVAPTVNANFSYVTRYLTYGSNPPLPTTVTTPEGKVLANPLLEQQKGIKALINEVDAGRMTLRAAQDRIVDMADGTTSVATLSYQFFTGKIPTKAGLDYLVSSPENPRDLNDGFYAGMSLENRYINFAVNLGKVGEGRAAFTANYGALSLADATAKAYAEIFGKAADAQKLAAMLTPERSSYFLSLGGDALGQKAAMVGFLLGEAAKSDTGPYAVMNENFLYDLADGVAAYGTDLRIYLDAGPVRVGLVGVSEFG